MNDAHILLRYTIRNDLFLIERKYNHAVIRRGFYVDIERSDKSHVAVVIFFETCLRNQENRKTIIYKNHIWATTYDDDRSTCYLIKFYNPFVKHTVVTFIVPRIFAYLMVCVKKNSAC